MKKQLIEKIKSLMDNDIFLNNYYKVFYQPKIKCLFFIYYDKMIKIWKIGDLNLINADVIGVCSATICNHVFRLIKMTEEYISNEK